MVFSLCKNFSFRLLWQRENSVVRKCLRAWRKLYMIWYCENPPAGRKRKGIEVQEQFFGRNLREAVCCHGNICLAIGYTKGVIKRSFWEDLFQIEHRVFRVGKLPGKRQYLFTLFASYCKIRYENMFSGRDKTGKRKQGCSYCSQNIRGFFWSWAGNRLQAIWAMELILTRFWKSVSL